MSTGLDAFTQTEMLEAFHGSSMSGKHILLAYSMIIGVNAKIILDLGLGNSTRVCRAAAEHTGGKVYSCDNDVARYQHLEAAQTDDWKFFCMPVAEMLDKVPTPYDFVFHDASHEYEIVRNDLIATFPKMSQFGLIVVHDTQHPRFRLLEAVEDAIKAVSATQKVTHVPLPYGCGLSVLRVENSAYPPIEPAGLLRGERVVTVPKALVDA